MSRPAEMRFDSPPSFPRVSGDEPVLMGVERFLVVFSPRERG